MAEGLGTLAIFAVVIWSLTSFVTRARGLPAGPFNLLGAAQGLSFVAAAALIGATALSGGNNLNPLSERKEASGFPELPKLELENPFSQASKPFADKLRELSEGPSSLLNDFQKDIDAQLQDVKKQVSDQASKVVSEATSKADKVTSSIRGAAEDVAKKASDQVADVASQVQGSAADAASKLTVTVPDYNELF